MIVVSPEIATKLEATMAKLHALFRPLPGLDALKVALKPWEPRNRHERRRAEALARRARG